MSTSRTEGDAALADGYLNSLDSMRSPTATKGCRRRQRGRETTSRRLVRDVGERLDRFEEAYAVIRALTRGAPTTYHGAYYAVQDAFCEPPPVQPALPILIGGGGERRTLPIAACFADVWHTWATSSLFPASPVSLIDTVRRPVETMFGGSAEPRLGSSRHPVTPPPAPTTAGLCWEPRKASRVNRPVPAGKS